MHPSLDQLARSAADHERHNRLQPAMSYAEQALVQDPSHALARLIAARCARRTGALDQALRHLHNVDRNQRGAPHLHEWAQILDNQGQYETAYKAFTIANRSRQADHQGVDWTLMPRFISHVVNSFTSDWVQSWAPLPPSHRAEPLFMVGFNRSGTTLLGRMLDAHPQVHVMEEVSAIYQARRVLDNHAAHDLATLEPTHLRAARDAYFAVVDAHVPAGFDGLVVDKLPLNTIELGLIHRLFPSAKTVFSLRHPADVVLSNFMQNYTPNPVTVHFDNLESTAKMYAQVMGLGLQLRSVLPMDVLDIRYEDLVDDWEPQVRRTLNFAGLHWDDQIRGYLERTQKQGLIETPSYAAVVEPVHRKAVGRRHNYASAIAPVVPVLTPFIDAFDYR